ncbi:Transferase [Parasponia andersonii]|uniref:Transferase n=1 Tax=Parasponia andersonii TaxID=3476 RepID=A0A2P5AL74_PARAD|nr:Transferase [Parasponia andersonii]
MDLIGSENTDGLFFTSFCNFHLYEMIDFGWGKSVWVTIPVATNQSNVVTLMDTSSGGVEAWVTLSKQEIATFGHVILEFSSS